jgi:hypothetical protein
MSGGRIATRGRPSNTKPGYRRGCGVPQAGGAVSPDAWAPAHDAYTALSTRGRNWLVDSAHTIRVQKPEVVISAVIEVLDEIRPSALHEPRSRCPRAAVRDRQRWVGTRLPGSRRSIACPQAPGGAARSSYRADYSRSPRGAAPCPSPILLKYPGIPLIFRARAHSPGLPAGSMTLLARTEARLWSRLAPESASVARPALPGPIPKRTTNTNNSQVPKCLQFQSLPGALPCEVAHTDTSLSVSLQGRVCLPKP